MMQIKVQGFAMAIQGVFRSGQKTRAVQMGDARCAQQRLNSGCGVRRLFILLRSSGKNGIFFEEQGLVRVW